MALIFAQKRVGLNGEPFTLYKLRTMDGDGNVTHPRLRSWRLDELPQVWNVIRGDMALIGPRPETPELTEFYAARLPEYRRRLTVKPGLTGLSCIRGHGHVEDRYELDEKARQLADDLEFIDRQGWRLRFAILARTPLAVWRQRKGVNKCQHLPNLDTAAMGESHRPS